MNEGEGSLGNRTNDEGELAVPDDMGHSGQLWRQTYIIGDIVYSERHE